MTLARYEHLGSTSLRSVAKDRLSGGIASIPPRAIERLRAKVGQSKLDWVYDRKTGRVIVERVPEVAIPSEPSVE